MGWFGYDNHLPPHCTHCPIGRRLCPREMVSWHSHFVSAVTGFSGSLEALEAQTDKIKRKKRYLGWSRPVSMEVGVAMVDCCLTSGKNLESRFVREIRVGSLEWLVKIGLLWRCVSHRMIIITIHFNEFNIVTLHVTVLVTFGSCLGIWVTDIHPLSRLYGVFFLTRQYTEEILNHYSQVILVSSIKRDQRLPGNDIYTTLGCENQTLIQPFNHGHPVRRTAFLLLRTPISPHFKIK